MVSFQFLGMNDIAGEILAHNKELKFFCYGTADVAPELHSMNLEKLLETSSSDRPQLNYKGSIHGTYLWYYM